MSGVVGSAGIESAAQPRSPVLLFDGQCGLCTALARRARDLDRRRHFEIRPFQEFSDVQLHAFGLTREQCRQRLYVVAPTRPGHGTAAGYRRHGGAFGVNYFLWRQPRWRLLVAILYLLPILLLAEAGVYELVTKNRGRISRWLGLKPAIRG